jgi:hypothetical protein
MVNTDGVVFGNYRTGILGKDLNRSFRGVDLSMYPVVKSIINLAREINRSYGDRFIGFYDFHGHSQKKNVFSYGP